MAELAGLEKVIAGLRGCVNNQQEHIKAQANTIIELAQSLILCQKERETLEEELSRLRTLESAVKALFLYIPGALDELLSDSERRFAQDTVVEALQLAREAVVDD